MSTPDEDLLATTEGVEEGSAASTVEDASVGSPSEPAAGAGPVAGPVDGEASPAPPLPVDAGASPAGPGQQLQAGEG